MRPFSSSNGMIPPNLSLAGLRLGVIRACGRRMRDDFPAAKSRRKEKGEREERAKGGAME